MHSHLNFFVLGCLRVQELCWLVAQRHLVTNNPVLFIKLSARNPKIDWHLNSPIRGVGLQTIWHQILITYSQQQNYSEREELSIRELTVCLQNLICSCSCSASVGYQGYQQFVNLAPGCWHMGTVAHEIGTWVGKRVGGGGMVAQVSSSLRASKPITAKAYYISGGLR